MEKIRFGAICEKLFLKPICGGLDEVLYFSEPQVVSAGLALSGFRTSLKGRAVLIGTQEEDFLEAQPEHKIEEMLERIMDAELVVLNSNRFEEVLRKVAIKCGTRAVLSLKPVSVSVDLALYIEGKLNSVEMIHGDLLDIGGVGVLIVGESGVGKSEISLELVTRGHLLVADDAVAVRRERNVLIGCSPSISRHLMEVRGIGIVDIRAMFGAGAIKIEQELEIVIQLEPFSDSKDYAEEHWYTLSGISLPMISLPLGQGRNISTLVEVAAKNLKLKAMGYDAMDELNRRIEKSKMEGRK